jgi:hypothetical protein
MACAQMFHKHVGDVLSLKTAGLIESLGYMVIGGRTIKFELEKKKSLFEVRNKLELENFKYVQIWIGCKLRCFCFHQWLNKIL